MTQEKIFQKITKKVEFYLRLLKIKQLLSRLANFQFGRQTESPIREKDKAYRTNTYNKVLDLIYQQTNELRGQKKEDSSDFSEKSPLVPPQGLDCATA